MVKMKNLIEKMWWKLVPYVEISVKWPVGMIVVGYDDSRWYDVGATWVEVESADPNDHYRPFMEEWIGKQRWDWSWYMGNTDARDNRLTIRLRKKHEIFASHLVIMWN